MCAYLCVLVCVLCVCIYVIVYMCVHVWKLPGHICSPAALQKEIHVFSNGLDPEVWLHSCPMWSDAGTLAM